MCIGNKNEKDQAIEDFDSENSSVLLISYETFRTYTEILMDRCDLLICDEGHRLKNLKTQTAMTLNEIECKRRIILTGTPLQNRLLEFYSCVSFVNPDILGTKQTFTRLFTEPILAGQDPNCSNKIKELALMRSNELCRRTSEFILRRTGKLLESYLPPRIEYIIFCNLLPLQKQLYQAYTESRFAKTTIENEIKDNVLQIIDSLRKITNHPDLIYNNPPKSKNLLEAWNFAMNLYPTDYQSFEDKSEFSSKMLIFDLIVRNASEIGDRVILASGYKKSLDLFQTLCEHKGYQYCRLDGDTTIKDRLKIVDRFNSKESQYQVFLLTSRAGGIGLNLIGANRLIILEPD